METETQNIYRTRDRNTAVRVAKELARLTDRCFEVASYDARTLEVRPQRRDVPVKAINRYKALALAITLTDRLGEN